MRNMATQVAKLQKDIHRRVNAYKIKYAQTILFNLITSTPVDSSVALSNWRVGINTPKSGAIDAYSFGSGGSTESVSSGMAYSIGNAVIQQARYKEDVHITNSIDYVALLNKGYSRQAPAQYIEASVEESKEQISRVKI